MAKLYNTTGNIATAYDYTPFGQVTAAGINQPFQWSSEFYDSELGLVYYNYRHYNPKDGRWINRDPIAEMGGWNLYEFIRNNTMIYSDIIGLITPEQIADCLSASVEVEKPAWGRWANGEQIRLTPGKAVRLKRGDHTMIVVDWKDGEECCKIKEEYERKKINSVSAKILELKPDRSDQDADDNQLPTRCFPGNVTGATVLGPKSPCEWRNPLAFKPVADGVIPIPISFNTKPIGLRVIIAVSSYVFFHENYYFNTI